MSDGRLEKSPTHQPHHKASGHSQGSLSYPVRRMRNTAVLVKWIEEHQTNPYPTKAEKQYLAYYSGMNLTQLSTWFANARRRIKKIGMKTWLEGRSTFTVDFFPSRPAMPEYSAPSGAAASYSLSATGHYSPYALSGLNSYPSPHHAPGLTSLQTHTTSGQRIPHNGSGSVYSVTDASSIQHSNAASINGGLYATGTHSARSALSSQPGMMTMMSPFSNWHMASATSALLPSANVSLHSARQSSNIAPLQSPLTAQVYTGDTSHLRTHSAQSLDDTPYSLPQHSPDQMLPECASAEPMLQESQKSQSAITN